MEQKEDRRKKKAIIMLFLLLIVINIAIGFVSKVQAAGRYPYDWINPEKYPGYAERIEELKRKHPNWKFTLLYTELDWNQVLKSENTGHGSSPKNLISASKSGEWLCPICGSKRYDNGSWCCASEKTIAYMMDPRNILNEKDIFQFEEVKYVQSAQTIEGIKKMTNNTFIAGEEIAKAIQTACQNANISPYYIISRILQEQGKSGSTTGKGMVSDGVTYYNIFNIGASGNSSQQIIANALERAKKEGWTSKEQSIIGGISFLKDRYINKGQNTLYLNKFDVDNSDGSLYSRQYMQNIQAAQNEALTVYNMYANTGKLEEGFNFIIPVYENMPSSQEVYPMNVETTGTYINVRSGPGTSYEIVTCIKEKGTVLLSVERGTEKDGWDKIVLPDGRIAYMNSSYIRQIDDVVTCSEAVTLNADKVILRNGPGKSHREVTTLNKGQIVTRIDKGRYDVDGYSWDRVLLADGRQGFIATNYLNTVDTTDVVKINAQGGLNLRQEPTTSSTAIRVLANGSTLTRIEKATNPGSQGYYWDKVITQDGVIGYVARQYLEEVNNDNNNNNNSGGNSTQNGIRKDEEKKQLIVEPKVTVQTIRDTYKDQVNEIPNKEGEIIATGDKVVLNGTSYTVIKLGDPNKDGKVSSADYISIKNSIMGTKELTDIEKLAADVNFDGKVSSADYIGVKNQIMGEKEITLAK